MRSNLLLPLGLLLPLFPLLPSSTREPLDLQDSSGAEQEEGIVERDIYGRPIVREKTEVQEQILGCWRLAELDSADLPPLGRSQAGYLLVTEDFLAIEIHVAWVDESGELDDDDFQSGIHEYRFDRFGRLLTSSLIGGLIGEDETGFYGLQFEKPGYERRFEVQVAGPTLILTRSDGAKLSFQRQLPRRRTIKDAFGRTIGERPKSRDAYGRGVGEEDG